jgi:hypothetical protein
MSNCSGGKAPAASACLPPHRGFAVKKKPPAVETAGGLPRPAWRESTPGLTFVARLCWLSGCAMSHRNETRGGLTVGRRRWLRVALLLGVVNALDGACLVLEHNPVGWRAVLLGTLVVFWAVYRWPS